MSLAVNFRRKFPTLAIDIAFEVATPGVTVLFGPSGCGKSTIVSAVAGLMRPNEGRIAIDDTTLLDTDAGIDVAPEKRRIGMVFQDVRLFPHMTVLANLRYGERRAPPGSIKYDEVVDLLGIEHLLARRSPTLSGGERQRIAIGRALLSQPSILAMDEPLAALDRPRKVEILPFLARLKTALALPILYVTHSLEELAALADSLVLIDSGRVVAAGPVDEIAGRSDLPIALRDDASAVMSGRVVSHDAPRRLTTIDCNGTPLLIPLLDAALDARLRVRIPAQEVILATEPPGASSVHNILDGHVRGISPDPVHHASLVEVQVKGGHLLARITPDAVEYLNLAPGRPVLTLVKSVSIEALPG